MKKNILIDAEEELLNDIKFANKVLNDIDSITISDMALVEISNLKNVLLEIFNAYLEDKITSSVLIDIIEVLEGIIDVKYCDEFPKTLSPKYNEDDTKSLGIDSILWFDIFRMYVSFKKNDICEFIKFLKSDNSLKAHQDLRAYLYKKSSTLKTWI